MATLPSCLRRCASDYRVRLKGAVAKAGAGCPPSMRSGGACRAACIGRVSSHEPVGPSVSLVRGAATGHWLAAGGLQRGALLGNQAVLLELADVAVQVGGVDVEFGGDLLDGDPGTALD
jgi:hypothetical protein